MRQGLFEVEGIDPVSLRTGSRMRKLHRLTMDGLCGAYVKRGRLCPISRSLPIVDPGELGGEELDTFGTAFRA
jgi:hypothetical protein